MGQRLNIEITRGKTVLANAYYHWSAYTSSSLSLLAKVVEKYEDPDAIGGIALAIELLNATGAGIVPEERARAAECPDLSPFVDKCNDAIDRNRGLLSITEDGIEDTQRWAEETIRFDIDDGMIYFGVCSVIGKDDFIEYYCDDDPESEGNESIYRALPEGDTSVLDFPYYEFDQFFDFVSETKNGFVTENGNVVTWIE